MVGTDVGDLDQQRWQRFASVSAKVFGVVLFIFFLDCLFPEQLPQKFLKYLLNFY